MLGQVDALFIYPVKSFAGISVEQAELTPFGLTGDRQWMLVNQQGIMQTQRKRPEMGLIHATPFGEGIRLNKRGLEPIDVMINTLETPRDVNIWKDTVQAYQAPPPINAWITSALNSPEPLQLVYFDQNAHREPGQVQRFGLKAKYFADAAPYLIANTRSLTKVNDALVSTDQATIDMRHFRPNIVISGPKAFQEHELSTMTHAQSGSMFTLVDACQRCVMITLNPDTARKRPNASPFTLLAELNPMPDNPKAPAFGVNARCDVDSNHCAIRVGDKVIFQ